MYGDQHSCLCTSISKGNLHPWPRMPHLSLLPWAIYLAPVNLLHDGKSHLSYSMSPMTNAPNQKYIFGQCQLLATYITPHNNVLRARDAWLGVSFFSSSTYQYCFDQTNKMK